VNSIYLQILSFTGCRRTCSSSRQQGRFHKNWQSVCMC